MTRPIRVAVAGCGSGFSSFIQGLEYYKRLGSGVSIPGLITERIGRYLPRDIEVVCAFDVDANKVGKDVAEAIWVYPNCAKRFADVPPLGVEVRPGFIGDGFSARRSAQFSLVEDPENVGRVLRESRAECFVSLIPTGSELSSKFYAERCLESRISYINCIPALIAPHEQERWARLFKDAGLLWIGSDGKSQIGATILNREIAELIVRRGGRIISIRQDNVGGNGDFDNLSDEERLANKRLSKTNSLKLSAQSDDVQAGPTGYDPALGDTKMAEIVIEIEFFGGQKASVNVALVVEDSPDLAGTLMDAIRLARISCELGETGSPAWCAEHFKHPVHRMLQSESRAIVERMIAQANSAARSAA